MLKEEKKMIIGQLKRLSEGEETKSYKFKVKHDNGSKTISTTGSSEDVAKKKIEKAEGCPESAITLIKENFGENEEFVSQGSYTISNHGGYEIMLSDDGEAARVRDAFGSDNPKTSDWLPIEYITSDENGETEPVIDPNGYNIPLNMVMKINRSINEEHGDGKIGTSLRSLLDGELAIAIRSIDLNNYNERNNLIDKIESSLNEGDWIYLSNGTTFTKTFTPSKK